MSNLESSKEILKLIGMPDRQTVDLPALTLLAMASLKENSLWSEAESKWIRIHDIIQFVNSNYNVSYSESRQYIILELQESLKIMVRLLILQIINIDSQLNF